MTDKGRRVLNIILALIISVGAWAYVVYNYKPMTEVRYNNVPVMFTGEQTLAEKGYGVVETSRDSIYVVLNQERVRTADISEGDISVIADVSNAVEGENSISLVITGPEGSQVAESELRTINVDVERVESRDFDLEVEYSGIIEDDLEPMITDVNYSKVTVVGAASEIESIERAVAFIEPGNLSENPRNFTRSLAVINKDGDKVLHMITYPDEVKFTAYAGHLKTVPLEVNVSDAYKDKYERTFNAPEMITIKGTSEAIANVDKISTKVINIGGMYEDTDVELEYELPEGIMISNRSEGLTLHVKVTDTTLEDNKDEDKTDNG